ncbi:hypothetical protein GCM10011371_01620 [Novosphingobium marinum]|uniref:Uncharacterized protein n=1 Tax=Novosphingobium marinum TaxID=1514948 RepID=A0A7Y9XSP8_9SPHN|nr:hypothetical protein [Novosphingobium marinum]NYH93854.1 hypothetical protein [Novosphingobium marinum]GGC17802.1 hypothetical protein GCM10011371_01620 [Novosphingobium marinum]
MAKFQITQSTMLPVFFNTDANVGYNSPNRQEDVFLVTFLMRCAASCSVIEREIKPDFERITVGTVNEHFIATVRKWERLRGTMQDGWISTARGSVNYQGRNGPAAFLVAVLNWDTGKAFPNAFPRIDLIPQCPAPVTALVRRSLCISG